MKRPIPTGLVPQVLVPGWRATAACKDWPTDLFFPERGADRRSEDHRATLARAVCALCPVRMPCLAVALGGAPEGESVMPRTSQLSGIWGGTNEIERRALRRQIAAGRPLVEVVAEAAVPPSSRHPSATTERASA